MDAERNALDGNEAAARAAYALSEVIALYPITPASPMGEWADEWATKGRKNLWGAVPAVVQMQSEAGAAGALHGALSAGSLAATFTASQGLLLMIPDMYKIAGELMPFVMHVASRSVATHALSIFGDHSDVMAARQTGFAMLASSSVQEAGDFAAIAHAATLFCRVPFLHFFDGFRTSHEIQNIATVGESVLRALVPEQALRVHRARALSPDHPTIRGTAQNPDVFFQAREAAEPFYRRAPTVVQQTMDRFAELTGRRYHLFDYVGSPRAERVIVVMGSAAGAAEETVEELARWGEKVGLVKVRLYRPFDAAAFLSFLPPTARSIAALDRTKEPGSLGEPLFLDVMAAVSEDPGRRDVRVVGGRYGLSSKEFTPAMAAAVFEELAREKPKSRFTVGIEDDVSGSSLPADPGFWVESPATRRAVFFGLGSDGTVGAVKGAAKTIAERAGWNVQGYSVYDSKKSGSMTVSHLRFGPRPIRSSYLIGSAGFVACHQESLLERHDMLRLAEPGGLFLLNTSRPEEAWDILPREVQSQIVAKRLRFYAIDAYGLSKEAGLGSRINTVMQACFFSLTKAVPDFMEAVKAQIRESYGSKDQGLADKNLRAVDAALNHLVEIVVPRRATARGTRRPPVPDEAPAFVRETLGPMIAGRGDELPVSALPPGGVFPTGTSRWEKRGIAQEVPAWEPALCLQCNKCALVCPHAAVRVKAYPAEGLRGAPARFKSDLWKGREFAPGTRYTVQVSPEDCTGCELCVVICPGQSTQRPERRSLAMVPRTPQLTKAENLNFSHFLSLAEPDVSGSAGPAALNPATVKGSQLRRPLFEFSGACAGCGETPYLKLMTQLFGDRLLIANATGCSSIFGGSLPTTPWTADAQGRGPAWSNSLFEDNAEFGLGMRLALDHQDGYARELLRRLAPMIEPELVRTILTADQREEAGVALQRERLAKLRRVLAGLQEPAAAELAAVADALARKSVWIVGGDGWAYDIGAGGLDHVLRSGANVKVLVLDTQVYSNTGGQASKSTPRGAVARFASAGKRLPRKNLAVEAVAMGGAYVAQVALGASDAQTVQAFVEAESCAGPALIVAYAHCIAHGIAMPEGLAQQKRAVACGQWPLFRFDPRKTGAGQAPLVIDSRPPSIPFGDYAWREGRFRRLAGLDVEAAAGLASEAEADIKKNWEFLQGLARILARG